MAKSSEYILFDFFRVIGQPVRIQILLVLAAQDSCVCHLEAVLGLRQASISQHLMALRKAGLLSTRREGRNIFYHLNHQEVAQLIRQAAALAGISVDFCDRLQTQPVPGCPCPHCNTGLPTNTACTSVKQVQP